MIILTIFLVIIGILLFFILALFILCLWASKQPVVKDEYFKKVSICMPIEQKYTCKGDYDVSYYEEPLKDKSFKKIEIWYPSELSMNQKSNLKYPLVIMANGSGIKASRYKPIFDHLASWGFIVVGNEDESSGSGYSSSVCLDHMIALNSSESSQFYGKIDISNIGIAGHSQGGLGAISAVTAQNNGDKYKVIYTASAPTYGISVNFLKNHYDISKLNIPYFQTAGTLKFDAGVDENTGISTLASLKEKYNSITEKVPKILARRVNTDHGDMLPYADGYMTAWFMFFLQDDLEAKKAFYGNDAEILHNANWVDVEKNF